MASAESSSTEPPDWVPALLHPYLGPSSGTTLRISSDPRRPAELAFERIAEGWSVEIDQAGTNRQTTIKVAEPAGDTRWILLNVGRGPVTLGGGVDQVQIASCRDNVRLILSEGTTDLDLCAGNFRIDGNQGSYRVRLVGDHDATFQLAGNATLTGIEAATAKTVNVANIAGPCRGDLDVTADQIVLKAANATGSMTCDTLTVSGDLVGAGEAGVTVRARREIRVVGRAVNATLLSDQAIAIGFPSRSQPTVDDVVVDASTVTRATVTRNSPAGGPVVQCLIVAGGDLEVANPVQSSLLHAGSRLVLAQGFDGAGLDVDQLLARVPEACRDQVREIPDGHVFAGDTVIVEGTIQLSTGQHTAAAVTLCSVQSIAGGRVAVPGGLFVADSVVKSTISAATVGIQDQTTGGTVLASDHLMVLVDGAAAGTQITARGSGYFHGPVAEPITWEPTAGAICSVAAGSTHLTVKSASCPTPDEAPELILDRTDHPDRDLTLSGAVRVTVEEPSQSAGSRRQAVTQLWRTATLGEQARLYVDASRVDLGVLDVAANHASVVQVRQTVTVDPCLRINRTRTACRLQLEPGGGLQVDSMSDTTADPIEGMVLPSIHVLGGYLAIDTELDEVTCRPASHDPDHPPVLSLNQDGAISDLRGQFQLASFEGRLTTKRPSRGSLRSLWGRLTNYTAIHRKPSKDGRPASLIGISSEHPAASDDANPINGGELIGIVVTDLPYADIAKLEQLHVFGPDGVALMELASDHSHVRKHERAQRLRRLVDVVSANASSGATRSAVLWAAACAQHQAIDKRHWIERLSRRLFRLVGYGYRPWPAFLTYSAWVLGLGWILWLLDDGAGCGEPGQFRPGPYSFGDQIVRVLLLPVSTFRLDFGGAAPYAPVGCSAGWHTLCFAVAGTVLAFLVVAVRNYMRTPKS